MIEEFQAKFLPKFTELARARVQTAIEVATRRDHDAAATSVREMHALAGEAGLLGLAAIVPLARACEDKAKRMRSTRTDDDAEALVDALRELGRVIEQVGSVKSKE